MKTVTVTVTKMLRDAKMSSSGNKSSINKQLIYTCNSTDDGHFGSMHTPRLLGWHDTNCYHVISRIAGQDYLLEPAEREQFGKMLRKMAKFCGVEVLTWCCLSNHFHLLIRISAPSTEHLRMELLADPECFFRHLKIIYTKRQVELIADEISNLRSQGHDVAADKVIGCYLARIGDLAVFVKELKQRFSIWYNQNHDRSGTLWDARYRSVLVENSATSLRTVACYIELNPVRAGLVDDPKDYRWSGYGQALGGDALARTGIAAIFATPHHGSPSVSSTAKTVHKQWQSIAEDYRLTLFGRAAETVGADGTVVRKGASRQAIEKAVAAKGKLPAGELFRLRVRHLSAGTALGSVNFLNELVKHRPNAVSDHRKTGARPIRALDAGDFHSLRDLRS